MIQRNLLTKQKETHRLREQTCGCYGEGWGEGIRTFGMDMYTQVHLKGMTNKDLLYSTRNSVQCYVAAWMWGNSVQCYVAAWMWGEFRGEWMYIYLWLCPFAVHLKLLQHCLLTDCTSIQNKKFFFFLKGKGKKEKEKGSIYIRKNNWEQCMQKRCQDAGGQRELGALSWAP